MDLLTDEAERWHELARDKGLEVCIEEALITYFTRQPTHRELLFFKAKLNPSESFDQSGFFEFTWTIINSPEMRIY